MFEMPHAQVCAAHTIAYKSCSRRVHLLCWEFECLHPASSSERSSAGVFLGGQWRVLSRTPAASLIKLDTVYLPTQTFEHDIQQSRLTILAGA
jgi:hypothetical protein